MLLSIFLLIVDKATYKNVKPVRSRPGILYGLEKVHKKTKKGLPTLREKCPNTELFLVRILPHLD